MRQEKFISGHKTINKESKGAITAFLKKEEHYNHDNHNLLAGYFFMREFMHEMVKEEKDLSIRGSASLPMYNEPFRVPTDLDLQASSPKQILELIRHIAATEKDAKITLSKVDITRNNVLEAHVAIDLNGFMASFNVDVAPKDCLENETKTMRKVITTDQVFDAKTISREGAIARKIDCILNKFNEPHPSYRIKDFHDIYMLCKDNEVNRALVGKTLRNIIDTEMRHPKDNLKRTRDDIGKLVTPTEDQIEKHWRKTGMKPNADLSRALEFSKDLVQEMEI